MNEIIDQSFRRIISEHFMKSYIKDATLFKIIDLIIIVVFHTEFTCPISVKYDNIHRLNQ